MWRISSAMRMAGLSAPPPISEDRLVPATRRGTALHAMAEAHANGEPWPGPIGGIDGYSDGLRLWFADFTPTVLFTERRVINKRKRLTGRIDLGVLLDGKPIIVDYKTGATAPWHQLQTAGYGDLADADPALRQILTNAGLHGPWFRACLYLPGDSHYRWRVHADNQDYYLFRSAVALIQWRHDHGLDTYTDPERPADDALQPGSAGTADGGEDHRDQFGC